MNHQTALILGRANLGVDDADIDRAVVALADALREPLQTITAQCPDLVL